MDKKENNVKINYKIVARRPGDIAVCYSDPTKAKKALGWNPTKTTFEELVRIMVEHDMNKVAREREEEHLKMNLAEYLEKGAVK